MSADCQQLAAWDAGLRKLMDDMANYQSLVAAEEKPQQPIKETCATLRSQGDQITKDNFQASKDNIEQTVRKLTYDSGSFAGVLDEDANARLRHSPECARRPACATSSAARRVPAIGRNQAISTPSIASCGRPDRLRHSAAEAGCMAASMAGDRYTP